MITSIQRIFGNLDKRLALPGETETVRIRKSTIAILGILAISINFLWLISFISLGLKIPAWINFLWGITMTFAVVYYFISKNATAFLNIFFATIIFYSAALQFNLGGYIQSGYILVVGVLIPMLAGVILSRKATIVWAIIYIAVLAGALILDPFIAKDIPQLPPNYYILSGFFTVLVIVIFGTIMILNLGSKLEYA